ncbi:MAG: phage replisome organizer N-terminal domain-containing protein, partial [Bacilli bacterium]|nr:phage replisome organizer N-terminal domain-containing protein [Bacilli bacterium]
MNEKKYYWLKLEENYFDLKVQKALRKLPSGSDMLICYLKMQLKYLNTGGIIEYQGIYDDLSQEIALDIDEEEDLVKMTLSVLEKWRVIEPSDGGLYISEMQSRIGSKTDVALRVAKYREKEKMLHCNNDVTKCNSIKEIDIDKEIDVDKEDNIKERFKPPTLEQVIEYVKDNNYNNVDPN